MQVFTPFIALFISCVLPNLVWNLAWEVLGLFVNLIGIPIMYILFTLKNSVSGGYTFLYDLQWGWFASFVVVIMVKMIMDIVAFLKRRKIKQSA